MNKLLKQNTMGLMTTKGYIRSFQEIGSDMEEAKAEYKQIMAALEEETCNEYLINTLKAALEELDVKIKGLMSEEEETWELFDFLKTSAEVLVMDI